MATLLIAGCSTALSDTDKKAANLIIPAPVGYTKEQQKQAAQERGFCHLVPMLCRMIDDYGRERDLLRVARGEKVDVTR